VERERGRASGCLSRRSELRSGRESSIGLVRPKCVRSESVEFRRRNETRRHDIRDDKELTPSSLLLLLRTNDANQRTRTIERKRETKRCEIRGSRSAYPCIARYRRTSPRLAISLVEHFGRLIVSVNLIRERKNANDSPRVHESGTIASSRYSALRFSRTKISLPQNCRRAFAT